MIPMATLQGLVKSRLAQWPAERLILLGLFLLSFLLFLWGITPWIEHRDFLSLSIPKASQDDSLITSPPASIEQTHLFGLYVQDYAHLPITTLPLSLEGTLINPTNPNLSTAIISVNGQNAQSFKVNDPLSVGAKIIAIYNDYCVLDHGGRLEKLIIPRTTLENAPATSEPGQNSGLQVIS
jgi:hypothetical protein